MTCGRLISQREDKQYCKYQSYLLILHSLANSFALNLSFFSVFRLYHVLRPKITVGVYVLNEFVCEETVKFGVFL